MLDSDVGKYWAVVLGCDINGLGIIRSLGEKKVPILALDPKPYALGMHSRFTSKSMVCPDPLKSESDLIEFLMDLGMSFSSTKILFSTNDSYVAALAKAKDKLEVYYKLPFPEWGVIKDIVDKENQYKKAAEYGIPLPKTFYPEKKEDIEKISEDINFPLILKPAYSQPFFIKFGIKGVRCDSSSELIKQFEKYSSAGFKMIIQEIIEGSASQLYEFQSYTNQSRETVAMFVGRKLEQYPPDFGIGTIFESVKEPRIFEIGLRVLKAFNYHGIAFSEFKLDMRDGEYKLIEINPRTTHCNSLSAECGINIPYIAYRDVLGMLRQKSTISYKEGKQWIWPENGFLKRKRFLIYIKNLFVRREYVYGIFSLRDPIPEIFLFYATLCLYIEGICSVIKKVLLKYE